jgi:hypothetical protein
MYRWMLAAVLAATPQLALAWGYEGHRVIAGIARYYLTPEASQRMDALLATDTDGLTDHDMASEATWADRYRSAGRSETGPWHYVDIELSKPDLNSACYGFPALASAASSGPQDDCVVHKVEEFQAELANPKTAPAERLLALKYLLHFVGDIHQPLHASDNHDRGGNCVLVALGGPRTTNLHSYWDTAVVTALGRDPDELARKLSAKIARADKASWERGNPRSWAEESYEVARQSVYTLGSSPGCDRDRAPVSLPASYHSAAQTAAAIQLEKAGVRLAVLLNRALGG